MCTRAHVHTCTVTLQERHMPLRDAARLIGLLVLSCKHVDFSASTSAGRMASGKAAPASKAIHEEVPRNPVMLALKFAVMARLEARRQEKTGRRQKGAHILGLAAVCEFVALSLLEGTQRAVDDMQRSRDSPWHSGKEKFYPSRVYDCWLSTATPYAAAKGCRLFISSSLVHTYVKGLFLPSAEATDAYVAHHENSYRQGHGHATMHG